MHWPPASILMRSGVSHVADSMSSWMTVVSGFTLLCFVDLHHLRMDHTPTVSQTQPFSYAGLQQQRSCLILTLILLGLRVPRRGRCWGWSGGRIGVFWDVDFCVCGLQASARRPAGTAACSEVKHHSEPLLPSQDRTGTSPPAAGKPVPWAGRRVSDRPCGGWRAIIFGFSLRVAPRTRLVAAGCWNLPFLQQRNAVRNGFLTLPPSLSAAFVSPPPTSAECFNLSEDLGVSAVMVAGVGLFTSAGPEWEIYLKKERLFAVRQIETRGGWRGMWLSESTAASFFLFFCCE